MRERGRERERKSVRERECERVLVVDQYLSQECYILQILHKYALFVFRLLFVNTTTV